MNTLKNCVIGITVIGIYMVAAVLLVPAIIFYAVTEPMEDGQ